MGTHRHEGNKNRWAAGKPPTDPTKVVPAPRYEPMTMPELVVKPHPRQADMDANRAVRSLVL